MHGKESFELLHKDDWEDAVCSVCLEFPHNAVLLLCSSHEKGCRPYMCGTSYRYSNCLDQFKKAYTKDPSPPRGQDGNQVDNFFGFEDESDFQAAPRSGEKCKVFDLTCPLCRGQVKGWTVVEAARMYLNAKKRSCTQDDCSFVGTYRELRKHVRALHPLAQPRQVDPVLEQKWRRLEREREREDVVSTIRSSMPGAMVLGDYVIEPGTQQAFDREYHDLNEMDEDSDIDSDFLHYLLSIHTFRSAHADFRTGHRWLRRGGHALNRESSSGMVRWAAVPEVSASSDLQEEPTVRQGRTVVLGRPERRRRWRSRSLS